MSSNDMFHNPKGNYFVSFRYKEKTTRRDSRGSGVVKDNEKYLKNETYFKDTISAQGGKSAAETNKKLKDE
jgi:hypothetical protein